MLRGGSIPPPETYNHIAMAKTKKRSKGVSHSLFWSLLRETPGYQEQYKEVIKEGLVHQWTKGLTSSLSVMYDKYPDRYSLMIEAMKGNSDQRQARYEAGRDKCAKRVIAAICAWLDKLGYKFETPQEKIRYVKAIACRAANCGNFNSIPESRLTAIYNLYCQKNSVGIDGNPALDYVVGKN